MAERLWNKYEAVILLEGLLDNLYNSVPKKTVIARVSRDLRKMAQNNGEEIDETFRNENGIYFQLQSMESALRGYTISKPSSKLFSEVVDIYRFNKTEYENLLKEAKMIINKDRSCKDEFMSYLKKKLPPSRIEQTNWCFKEIDKYCLKKGILTKPIFETTDYDTIKNVKRNIENSKEFRLKHAGNNSKIVSALYFYCDFLGERKNEQNKSKVANELKKENVVKEKLESEKDTTFENNITVENKGNDNLKDSKGTTYNDPIIRTNEDVRLSTKYPIIYKRVFYALQESSSNKNGITTEEIVNATQHIGRASDIEEILDNASWAESKGERYWFSKNIVSHDADIANAGCDDDQPDRNINISDDSRKEYKQVLKTYFSKGFRLNSAIEIRRFKKVYEELIGKNLVDSDDKIGKEIRQICLVYDGRAYLPDMVMSEDLQEKVLNYINENFKNGQSAIYYETICAKFADEFLDYPVHDNPEMLKDYLCTVANGEYFYNQNTITKDKNRVTDSLTEVRFCLKEAYRPMKLEEIFVALPHLPQDEIKRILANNADFIWNANGEYFHESILQLSEKDLEEIAGIIEQTIKEKDFISGSELYKATNLKYPQIIENNHEISEIGFRDGLKYKFGTRFSFKGKIISKAGEKLSMNQVFADFAKNRDSFSLSELITLADELGSSIYFEPIYENSLRISMEQFVAKDRACFNKEEIDLALDQICTGNYIAIQEVTNFGMFPYVGFPWNSFLLEHYVAEYSGKYFLLHTGFNCYKCVGAIVKRNKGFNTFDDLIVDVLSYAGIKLDKDVSLQFLVDNGYLAKRTYYKIEDLIIQATAKRNRKGIT